MCLYGAITLFDGLFHFPVKAIKLSNVAYTTKHQTVYKYWSQLNIRRIGMIVIKRHQNKIISWSFQRIFKGPGWMGCGILSECRLWGWHDSACESYSHPRFAGLISMLICTPAYSSHLPGTVALTSRTVLDLAILPLGASAGLVWPTWEEETGVYSPGLRMLGKLYLLRT